MTSLREWTEFSTAVASDALDRLGIAGQALGIRPVDPVSRLLGRAFTVRMTPVGGSGATVGDYIDEVEPGGVVVIDNGGRSDASVWGGILTRVARHRGVAGTVIHGACRDSTEIVAAGYPVFSSAITMRTGKDRVGVAEIGGTVSLAGAAVAPGDLILGDQDGVVVIPAGFAPRVFAACREILETEEAIERAVAQGSRLDQARSSFGYHELQRKDRVQ